MITLDDLYLEGDPASPPTNRPETARASEGTSVRRYLCWGLAMLSLGAAGIHFSVMGDHFNLTLVLCVVGGAGGTGLVAAPAAAAAACPSSGGVSIPRATASGDVVFRGGGWGHGLGMSQYGAQGAARLGCDAGQILTRYYAGTTVAAKAMPTSSRPISLRPVATACANSPNTINSDSGGTQPLRQASA